MTAATTRWPPPKLTAHSWLTPPAAGLISLQCGQDKCDPKVGEGRAWQALMMPARRRVRRGAADHIDERAASASVPRQPHRAVLGSGIEREQRDAHEVTGRYWKGRLAGARVQPPWASGREPATRTDKIPGEVPVQSAGVRVAEGIRCKLEAHGGPGGGRWGAGHASKAAAACVGTRNGQQPGRPGRAAATRCAPPQRVCIIRVLSWDVRAASCGGGAWGRQRRGAARASRAEAGAREQEQREVWGNNAWAGARA